MDNNELDKILKDKLKDTIKPSKEIENKIAKKIEEQKNSTFEKVNVYPNKKSYKRLTQVLSFAAVFVLIFTFGILYNGNWKNQIIPDISNQSNEVVKIKAIKPTKLESGIVAKDSDFIITVEEENSSVDGVRKSLYVEPALEYEITKTGNKEYKLNFKQNIPDNIILKLEYVKNQITEDSWAYQTNKNLSVVKTFPANESYVVSKNTVIDIYFSYANVENFEENISITPKIEGKWEHHGKIWRLTPSNTLKDEQKYIVIINKNVKADEKTMEDDYKFNFVVGESYGRYYHKPLSEDEINTFAENEQIRIYYEKSSEKSDIKKVIIRNFQDADTFIEYLKNGDYSKSSILGEFDFQDKNLDTDNFIELKKSLSEGYYVASIQSKNGTELFNAPIQVNNIQSYALETERNIIIWVANDGKIAEGIDVSYLGKTAKTNNDGIAKFESDGTTNMKYAKVGNGTNKLVIGFNNFTHDSYPNAFVYTDRKLYKNNDTISIWGFVPRTLFYDNIDENGFYISLDDTQKERISIDKNGSFQYKFDLNKYNSDFSSVELYYKDTPIGCRSIKIENYELQNYEYEIISNKNYAYIGEKIEFDVKVKHITGILVPGKAVVAEYEGRTVRAITNDKGIAHISFDAIANYLDDRSGFEEQSISVYNGDLEEYTNTEEYMKVYVYAKDVYAEIDEPKKENETIYNISLYKIINDKNKNVDNINELYDGTYDTEVKLSLEEETHTRYIEGYRYNEYTKQNETVYDWNIDKNIKNMDIVKTNNGKFSIDKNSIKMQKDSEEKWFLYRVILEYKDRKGNLVKDSVSIYNLFVEPKKTGHWDETDFYNPRYCMYRYFFDAEEYDSGNRKINVGDNIKLKLKESTASGEQEIQNQGKILRIVYGKDIQKFDIIENNSFDYVFSEKNGTGIKITGAYFLNGKFYRMPAKYFDFDENSKKIDIEISPDKNEYKPGDKVTLNIKTTNNGKSIKSIVNISVANEAVFLIEGNDESTLLDRIYSSENYPGYTFSSHLDELENSEPGKGGGGGDGDIRSRFSDTAFFDTVETNANGNATVTFNLPDNITTYRVTAHAANKDLYLGENTKDIVSTLDFFIQYTEPRGVKTSDDLVLNATSISDEEYKVDFEFTIEELNKTLKASETTNKMASVNFGKLETGKYHVMIKGTNGDKTDSVKYEFEVVESAQEVKNKTTISIDEHANIKPSKNPITLEIYNKQMKQYLDYIDFVEKTNSSRLDTRIAYREIQKIKNKYYGNNFIVNEIDVDEYRGENYLYLAAQNEPILNDLEYLKEASDTNNYNKLLLTLSFEFLGDYENARSIYNNLNLTDSEKEEYSSIIIIIDTFINKTEVVNKINKLIQEKPADEYLRFAILSFFKNNSNEIAKEEKVKIISDKVNETISINGLEIKTYKIYDSDLSEIKFETSSKDIMTSYYYQTSLENINSDKVSKDITIKIKGDVKKNKQINLVIDFSKIKNTEGEVQIALPNNLRLAKDYNKGEDDYYKKYYLSSNRIDHLTYYKQKDCNEIKIPLMVTTEGNFKFENIVFTIGDGIYHISNSLEIK